ncbi:MAG: GAF domain-containing protein [Minicystis sp.]
MLRNARALRHTLHELREQEWLQASLVTLNAVLREEQEPAALGQRVLAQVVSVVPTAVGTMSWRGEDGRFVQLAGYALEGSRAPFAAGEGLAGEAARTRKVVAVAGLPAAHLVLSAGAARGASANAVAVPLLYRDQVEGVLELGGFAPFTQAHLTFLERASESIAIALRIGPFAGPDQGPAADLPAAGGGAAGAARGADPDQRGAGAAGPPAGGAIRRSRKPTAASKRRAARSSARPSSWPRPRATSRSSSPTCRTSCARRSTACSSWPASCRRTATGNLDEKQVRYARTIHCAGTDLLNLINGILDLAKIESGTVELDLAEVPFSEFGDGVEATLRPLAAQKGLHFSIDGPRPAAVPFHRQQAPAADPQEPAVQRLQVHPGGPGQARAGDADHRSRRCRTRQRPAPGQGRRGLRRQRHRHRHPGRQAAGDLRGLPAGRWRHQPEVRRHRPGPVDQPRARQLLGGELQLVSTPGKGSTFTLFLPSTHGAGGPVAAHRPTVARLPTVAEPAARPCRSCSRRRTRPVGVVDDRGTISRGRPARPDRRGRSGLRRASCSISHANRASRSVACAMAAPVLALAQGFLPDAITLDVRLADVDGWRGTRPPQARPCTRHIPVHVISVDDERTRGLRHGRGRRT